MSIGEVVKLSGVQPLKLPGEPDLKTLLFLLRFI